MTYFSTERKLFLAPTLAILLLVIVFPALYLFRLSLLRYSLTGGEPAFAGLANYHTLLSDPRFLNALGNTVYFTAVSVFLEVALGLGIALLLNRAFRGKGIMRAVIILPWAIPTVVSAKIWNWMYNPDFGIINRLLGAGINWLGSPELALNAAILMDVWKTTPFVALLLIAGLSGIPPELNAAARLDGAGPLDRFLAVTFPFIRPLLIVALIFRTVDAFRVFDAIYVLTGGGPGNSTETLSVYAYKLYFQTLEFGYASSVSAVMFLLAGLVTVFYVRAMAGKTA